MLQSSPSATRPNYPTQGQRTHNGGMSRRLWHRSDLDNERSVRAIEKGHLTTKITCSRKPDDIRKISLQVKGRSVDKSKCGGIAITGIGTQAVGKG